MEIGYLTVKFFEHFSDYFIFPQYHRGVTDIAIQVPITNMPNSLGSLVITPVISRKNENAKLTILHAKKNGRAGFIISSPIVLHPLKSGSREKYVPEVDKVLRNGTSLINWI